MRRTTAIEIKQEGGGTRVKFTRSPLWYSHQGGRDYRNLSRASCNRLDHALWALAAHRGIDAATPYTFPDHLTVEFTIKRDRKALR